MTAPARIDIGLKPRILVIALRRLGDVLLTTPLIRSLRRAWPEAVIDALVFADTAGILAGNPDINRVIAMPPRPSAAQSLTLGARLLRRYDLAISTQSGDRPTGFAIAAGRVRVAPVNGKLNGRVKRALLDRSVAVTAGAHRVEEMLRLADLLGIARVPELVAPAARDIEGLPDGGYAVIHAAPMFRYKQWTKDGWRKLAAALAGQGLSVIATGGPADDERRYLDEIWSGVRVTRLDGRLDWPQLAGLLAKARVYVGPDTSVTHLAAASGCPTVALYGPTDPRLWGPWPAGGLDQPWAAAGTIQQRGNVFLVQHAFPCSPCQLEGCERRLGSHSACLAELAADQVIEAVHYAVDSKIAPA
ncbi:MAG TPA: glycosyltransferase family 9 protein [Bradyrhizobium sp.]